jgi:Zn-dependent protease
MPTNEGSIRLFRLAGIEVFLHWSWFLVALYEMQRRSEYGSLAWNGAEYLTLFGIVLLHELGHSLACRQVGGRAERIVLWPLGGVAYVDPPPRPGATLWSIAAGPLVNLALAPLLFGAIVAAGAAGLAETAPDFATFLGAVFTVNLVILAFNLLPVYPLDGGQILRSLLWFALGRARSLTVASVIGFVGVLGLLALAVRLGSFWIGIIAVFAGMSCWQGFQHSRALSQLAALPRRPGYTCPSCRAGPLLGPAWGCGRCGAAFDAFETGARCPACGEDFGAAFCADCGRSSPLGEWAGRPV